MELLTDDVFPLFTTDNFAVFPSGFAFSLYQGSFLLKSMRNNHQISLKIQVASKEREKKNQKEILMKDGPEIEVMQ